MTNDQILKTLDKLQVVITDSHLVYTSGKHGSAYVNKDALYLHTEQTAQLCEEIADRFLNDNVDVVVGPAIGGVILAQWVAHFLTVKSKKEVYAVYAEKNEDKTGFVIKRGYDKVLPGKRVLVVEDILTTGGSAKKVVETVKSFGGVVVGLAVLCNRGGVGSDSVGNPPRLEALVSVKFDAWDAADCPLCEAGVPVNTDVGYGRKFLEQKKA